MRSVTFAASAAAALAVAGLVAGSPSSAAAKAHDENPRRCWPGTRSPSKPGWP